jgi:hypothetical protein
MATTCFTFHEACAILCERASFGLVRARDRTEAVTRGRKLSYRARPKYPHGAQSHGDLNYPCREISAPMHPMQSLLRNGCSDGRRRSNRAGAVSKPLKIIRAIDVGSTHLMLAQVVFSHERPIRAANGDSGFHRCVVRSVTIVSIMFHEDEGWARVTRVVLRLTSSRYSRRRLAIDRTRGMLMQVSGRNLPPRSICRFARPAW